MNGFTLIRIGFIGTIKMKVKVIREIGEYHIKYLALEDGIIVTSCGDHPTFGIKDLEDMKIFIKKGEFFQLPKEYIRKNVFEFRKMKRLRKKHYRDYSWRSNPEAICVARPSRWGNPFKIADWGRNGCLLKFREWLVDKIIEDPYFLEPLRGKDLVCYCPLDLPCHADILIEFIEKPTVGAFNGYE